MSWTLWIAAAAISREAASQPFGLLAISGFLYLLGFFGPSLVALTLPARADAHAGMPKNTPHLK
ncbi:MAG TPA: hypothetical protein VJS64_03120 [Pyrinomonadaceae bacterium]|nr:hypothetical protein [Pyrinomonadaceae bacterium]